MFIFILVTMIVLLALLFFVGPFVIALYEISLHRRFQKGQK